jgi:putative Holliday junction resolvase
MTDHGTVFCGVDYGTKRIGLAVGDLAGSIASPLCMVDGRGSPEQLARRLLDAVAEYNVGAWVVGLPLDEDGTEGTQAKRVRRFAENLQRFTGMPLHIWDESLTSCVAEDLLTGADLTRRKRKARLDAVAAQVMLQSFLDARRPVGGGRRES